MSERQFPLTFAAAKRAEKSQWAIGDALLEEIGPPHKGAKQDHAFKACAAELADRGVPYSTDRLRHLRDTAHAFDLDRRRSTLGIEAHFEAGTPAVLDKAEALAAEEGVAVTTRYIRQVKKASKKQERKAKKTKAPARSPKRTEESATTVLRREIDLSELELLALNAKREGRKFAEKIAGVELTAEEKGDLRAEIDEVIKTWQAVRGVVAHSISSEIEDYLKAVS